MGHRKKSAGNDRGDRARAVLAFIAALMVMVTCGTRSALADVDWHEKGANMSATVGPWSYPEGREFALAEFLGYDWSSLSLQVRNDILNDSNGDNQFKQLLDHNVLNVQYESGEGALNWPVVSIWSQLFGLDEMWDIETTNERYVAAQDVMKKYIFPREGEEQEEQPTTSRTLTCNVLKGDSSGSSTVVLSTSTYNNAYNNGCRYFYAVLAPITYDNGDLGSHGYQIVASETPVSISYTEMTRNKKIYYKINFSSENTIYGQEAFNGGYTVTKSGSTCVFSGTMTVNGNLYSMGKSFTWDPSRSSQYAYYLATNKAEQVVTPPYEPTPDPTPTAPTLVIGDVTVDLSNGPYTVNNTTYSVVYAPDNSWSIQVETHTDNQYGGNVTATDPTDYTSILNAILAAINAMRSELNQFNNQLNANITSMTNILNTSIKAAETELNGQLQTMQTQQHNDLQTLQTNLQNNFNGKMDAFATDLWANMSALDSDLIEEMDAVARYIVGNLNYGDTFSDKNIITWLKKIYSRLGSQPVIKNPTEDPKGWFDDLKKLLETILDTALAGVDTAALATLWNTAKSHFPLSLPWDMLAIVGLLAHEPITPAIDYPIVYNGTTLAEIEFDLSEYEDVADVTRKMSLVVFAMGLLITYPQIFHTLEPLTKALRG